MESAVALV